MDDQSVCTTTLVRAAKLLLLCRRPYWAAMVTLWRPLCALLGRRAPPSNGVCFEYTQSMCLRSMRSHRVQWQCHCVADCVCTARTSAFCIFLRMSCDRPPGVTGVLNVTTINSNCPAAVIETSYSLEILQKT